MAALADGTIVVVAAGHTLSAVLRQAVDELSRATESLMGLSSTRRAARGL